MPSKYTIESAFYSHSLLSVFLINFVLSVACLNTNTHTRTHIDPHIVFHISTYENSIFYALSSVYSLRYHIYDWTFNLFRAMFVSSTPCNVMFVMCKTVFDQLVRSTAKKTASWFKELHSARWLMWEFWFHEPFQHSPVSSTQNTEHLLWTWKNIIFVT